jgi:hypothetical protein
VVEGLECVLVVGSREHDQRRGHIVGPVLGDRLRGLEAGHSRHPDVEKEHLRAQPERCLDRGGAMPDPGDDFELGPEPCELRLQLGGEQRFVFGDQGGGMHGARGSVVRPAM